MKATSGQLCEVCGGDIIEPEDGAADERSDIVPRNGRWIHAGCASGGDDHDQRTTRKRPASKRAKELTKETTGRAPGPAPLQAEGHAMQEPTQLPSDILFEIPEIPPEGLLLPNLDEETYHAHKGSLSSTGAKRIRVAPALFKHELDNPVQKRVFDYGSVCHKYALGVGPEVVELERVDSKTGATSVATDYRSPSTRVMAASAKQEGKIGLLQREHEHIKAMADVLRQHPLAMRLFEKGDPEVSGFAYDEDTGVLMRGRADWLRKRILIDYKSSVTANPSALGRIAYNNGWYQQTPYYIDLFRDLGYDIAEFYHVVQEKTAPYLVSVVKLSQNAIDLGRLHNAEALQMYRDCTESGIWPGYGDPDLFAPIDIPAWAYRGEIEVEEVAA